MSEHNDEATIDVRETGSASPDSAEAKATPPSRSVAPLSTDRPPSAAVRALLRLHAMENKERYAFALVMFVGAGLILPFLGSVGFFDPWETHYGEVARSMAERDDYLYPFWKSAYFFSKPILLFWLTAPLYKLIGAGDAVGALPALTEWCGRLPVAVFGLSMLATLTLVMRRMWNLRAATLGGICLATLPFFGFMSRQAITDTLYVAPMSAAIGILAWLFLDDEDERERKRNLPMPKAVTAFFALCWLPQLWEIGRTGAFLNRVAVFGSEGSTRVAFSLLLVSVAGALLALLHKIGRDPYLLLAAAFLALATLGKGPHAVAFTVLVCALYLLASGEWHVLRRPTVIVAAAVYLCIAAPWVVVMLVFPGKDKEQKSWYKRYVLYDLFGRLGGVHGERGTHEYYLRYLAFGMFPWAPAAFLAVLEALKRKLSPTKIRTRQERFTLFVAIWAMTLFVFFTLTSTKFHHYCYPIAVPAAMLVGWWLDDKLRTGISTSNGLLMALGLAVVVMARDLVSQPWQLPDLFSYHYVSYKPEYYFPTDAAFRISKQDVSWWQLGLGAAFIIAALVLVVGTVTDMVVAFARERSNTGDDSVRWAFSLSRFSAAALGNGQNKVENAGFVLGFMLCGMLSACFLVQGFWVAVSQHWTQRHITDTYYAMAEPGEPLVAYQMDWKGETFYSHNTEQQIMKSATDLKAEVEKPGTLYVIVQTDRYKRLKTAVGKDYKKKLRIVDQSNTKWYLVQIKD